MAFGYNFYVVGDEFRDFAGNHWAVGWMAKQSSAAQASMQLLQSEMSMAVQMETVDGQQRFQLVHYDSDNAQHATLAKIDLKLPVLIPSNNSLNKNNIELTYYQDGHHITICRAW